MRNKSSERSAGRRIAAGVAYVLFLGLAFAVGTGAGWIKQSALLGALVAQQLHPKAPQEVFGKNDLTLLILGCDEDRFYRGVKLHGSNIMKKYARADMILIARLNFAKHTITGVSIPRDTEVRMPGYRRMKINATHNIPGKSLEESGELTKLGVETLLPGVHIDRIVTLDFDAFQDMVDAVGGVKVFVDKRMKYDDVAGNVHVNFFPGWTVLNGYDADMFVRFRHSDSDFKRQDRQKQFLAAFKQAVFTNPARLPTVLTEAGKVLNGAMNDQEIACLASFVKTVPPDGIRLGMVDVTESGKGTFLEIDQDKLPRKLAEYDLVDEPVTSTDSDGGEKQ